MSFDYCGHNKNVDNQFTLSGTFVDTKVALAHAIEYSQKIKVPLHVLSACYGLIPLIHVLNGLGWPKEIRSILSVNGLLGINELLSFDRYKPYLKKYGLHFKDKVDFIEFMAGNKKRVTGSKKLYLKALAEYLSVIFPELVEIISEDSFGMLNYSKAEFYKSFYEFIGMDLPDVEIPERLSCLFFFGENDMTLNFKSEEVRSRYISKIKGVAPHAQLCNIKIDHFGRGEDHYIIGEKGMDFIKKSEK